VTAIEGYLHRREDRAEGTPPLRPCRRCRLA